MLTPGCDLNLVTGEVSQTAVDFFFPGRIPCYLVRRYSSQERRAKGVFGAGWRDNLRLSLRAEGGKLLLQGVTSRKDVAFPMPGRGASGAAKLPGYVLEFTAGVWVLQDSGSRFFLFDGRADSESRYRLLARRDVDGNEITYTYGPFGELQEIVDTLGRHISFSYDLSGRISDIRVSPPSEGRELLLATYSYDLNGDLTTIQDAAGTAAHFDYVDHYLTRVTNRKGGELYFAYDKEGRAVARWRGDGSLCRIVHRDPVRRRIQVLNSFGHQWLLEVDEDGHILKQTDPLGRVREDVYDPAGKIVFSGVNVIGPPCVTTRDEGAHSDTISCAGNQTVVFYNNFGSPVRIVDALGNAWLFEYDQNGHKTAQISPAGANFRFEYQPDGDLRQLADPGGDVWRVEREPFRISDTDQLGFIGSRTFDLLHRLILITGPLGESIRIERDAVGNASRIVWPDGGEWTITYDPEAQPIEVRSASGAITRMESDLYGRPTSITDPNGGTYVIEWDQEDNYVVIRNPAGAQAVFQYDPVGRPIAIRHFDGRRTSIDYDYADHPVRYSTPETGTGTTHAFNEVGAVIARSCSRGVEWSFSRGPSHEVLLAESRLGTWKYKWDAEKVFVKEENPLRSISYTRDAMRRRTSLEDSLGLRLDYEWDLRSRLQSLTIGKQWRYEFQYDRRDLIREMHVPGGSLVSFEYDSMRRMTNRVVRGPNGSVLAARAFCWDLDGRLTQTDDLRLGLRSFRVDTGGRLLAVAGTGILGEAYRHDVASNVLSAADGVPVWVDPGNQVRRAGNTVFETNPEGHIALRSDSRGSVQYEYDGDGLLVSVTLVDGSVVRNAYDFLGRRIRKEHAGRVTRYFWDGIALQGEQTDSEPPVWYIFLPGSVIPLAIVSRETLYSLTFDQVGTVTEAFDIHGDVAWSCDMTAFWSLRREEGRLDQPIRALGQYHDRETGLYYNWFRHFDPWLGRYISADPVGYRNSVNLYWYSSNPTIWVDPDGLGLENGVLTLMPHCDWDEVQMKDFNEKVGDLNRAAEKPGGIKVTKEDYDKFARDCESPADHFKKCPQTEEQKERLDGHENTGDPCTDVDIDHRVELVLGGKDECANLTPRNASVNRSVGSTIGGSLRAGLKSASEVVISSVVASDECREKKRKGGPCDE